MIKLDHEHKISDDLKMHFFFSRSRDKTASLLYLLSEQIPENENTIIFAATRHHVEYLNTLLLTSGFNCVYIFGELDNVARQIAITKFRKG